MTYYLVWGKLNLASEKGLTVIMKIHSITPNPMLGINNNNQMLHKKSIVSDSIADIANMQERKDMYIPKDSFEDASIETAMYDQNGQLPKFYQGKELNTKNIAPDVDFSKINGIVSELYERKPTEEETRLLNFSMQLDANGLKQVMQETLRLGKALNLKYVDQSLDELYAMYDKKFGTDSSDKVKYFNSLRTQSSNVQQMLSSLQKALDAGKTRDDIMDFAPDGSFSKDDFDYIMNIADHYNYDIKDQKLTDKDVVNTENKKVSSDLQNVMKDLFS